MHTPSKVRNLNLAMDANENVLWLDVAVHHMFLVEIFESSSHLSDVLCCLPLRKPILSPEMLVQFSFAGEFENEEHSLTVMEMAVKAQDIRMAQITVDFDFSSDLFLDFALLQLALMKHLQGTHKAC